jgi:hypothetical protein
MSNSNGGIGLGTIIVCAFIFILMFCDDDKTDVTEVVVETQEKAIDEPKKKIKENLQDVVISAKKAFNRVKDEVEQKKKLLKDETKRKKWKLMQNIWKKINPKKRSLKNYDKT